MKKIVVFVFLILSLIIAVNASAGPSLERILKNGELLASGPVKELLAEDEIIETSCENNEKLKQLLEQAKMVKEVETENGLLVITLHEKISPADINAFAFSNNLVIHHMLSRKRSLESHFLELVKEE